MNNHEKATRVAIGRFAVIAPLVDGSFSGVSFEKFYKDRSTIKFNVEGVKSTIAPSTIKRWHLNYKKYGLIGITPKPRSDKFVNRKLSESIKFEILQLLDKYPRAKSTFIYDTLRDKDIIKFNEISLATVRRFVRLNRVDSSTIDNSRRSFEFEFANDCWQADTSYTVKIQVGKSKKTTFLVLILDDASRVIVGFDFFTSDNATNFQSVLKDAIKRYGVPSKLFVDNGGPYKNFQLQRICAVNGINLINSKPYSPQSKGKVERVFNTIKYSWMEYLSDEEKTDLSTLKQSLENFLINKYHNSIHSSLNNLSPLERFSKDSKRIRRVDPQELDISFFHQSTRKVRSDACISNLSTTYEVPGVFINSKVDVRYNPSNLDEAFIVDSDTWIAISRVDKISNSIIKRKGVQF